ncbi:MAG: ComF family protein [Alphaproteobacteria bacterium]|nr:ComF family protein [Alphaproteobacteria bacterium]
MPLLSALPRLASLAAKSAMDTVFPPRCYACNELTGGQHGLCAPCWEGVNFISAPFCARCGMPFAHGMGSEAAECMPCLTLSPPFAKARAVFAYDDGSRRLITRYKYDDRTHATPMYAAWLARAGAELLGEADYIIPVPLHRWRLVQRRYNQSALLVQGLAKLSEKPALLSGLRRTRHTQQQVGLTREQRIANVEDAFAIPPKHAAQLQGKTVLLVDDVLTTGATIESCTRALLDAGVATVHVLTLGRTTDDDV